MGVHDALCNSNLVYNKQAEATLVSYKMDVSKKIMLQSKCESSIEDHKTKKRIESIAKFTLVMDLLLTKSTEPMQ